MTEDFWKPHTATAYALDHFLYFDEDQDLDEEQMTEFSPVEAAHLIELIERGLVAEGEVFSHKGWHHTLSRNGDTWSGSLWDGPTGDERRYLPQFNEWDD
jgi:hypothetical protein